MIDTKTPEELLAEAMLCVDGLSAASDDLPYGNLYALAEDAICRYGQACADEAVAKALAGHAAMSHVTTNVVTQREDAIDMRPSLRPAAFTEAMMDAWEQDRSAEMDAPTPASPAAATKPKPVCPSCGTRLRRDVVDAEWCYCRNIQCERRLGQRASLYDWSDTDPMEGNQG